MSSNQANNESIQANTDSYLQQLEESRPLQELARPAINVLQLPSGSRGLDAGCGIGHFTFWLAEAVGSGGHVIGLDIAPKFLDYARELADTIGLSEQTSFREGNVDHLPFDDDSFDWAWSSSCVGYAPGDPLLSLKELMRVVKPRGCIALLAWSSEQLLPGYPLLETHLKATPAGVAPFIEGKNPELHFSRALGWFRQIGLRNPKVKTFVGDAHAPLSKEVRIALTSLFQMRWPGVESALSPEDLTVYERICDTNSPDFLLNHPDYYAFFTYTMFWGEVPPKKLICEHAVV